MAKRIITTENLEEDSKIEGAVKTAAFYQNISDRRKQRRHLVFT